MRALLPLVLLLTTSAAHAEGPKNWTGTMQKLYGTLAKILTTVTSDERFNDRAARKELQANAKELAKLAHDLNRKGGVSSPDKDPSVIIFGKLFADQARNASSMLNAGNREYARSILKSLPGYCISCHTRTKSGPSFDTLPLNPTVEGLRPMEKGEFFAASRQYDRALAELDKVLANPDAPRSAPLDWSRAVRFSLAIAVRAKKDPALSMRITERVLEAQAAPFFMKEDARKWRESIVSWQKETARQGATEEGMKSEAVRLWAEAHELQRYPADRSADVVYLRASAAAHELLQAYPDGKLAGEGYLIAGMAYEVLRNFYIGELNEIYFEACVRNYPRSTLAQLCFQRYQASVYDGFTGSSGTHLPDDLKDKLKELETLTHIPVPTGGPQ